MAIAPANKKQSAALSQRVAALCYEFKASDVTILALEGVTDMADFFVIASGSSDTHVRSTARRRRGTGRGRNRGRALVTLRGCGAIHRIAILPWPDRSSISKAGPANNKYRGKGGTYHGHPEPESKTG